MTGGRRRVHGILLFPCCGDWLRLRDRICTGMTANKREVQDKARTCVQFGKGVAKMSFISRLGSWAHLKSCPGIPKWQGTRLCAKDIDFRRRRAGRSSARRGVLPCLCPPRTRAISQTTKHINVICGRSWAAMSSERMERVYQPKQTAASASKYSVVLHHCRSINNP